MTDHEPTDEELSQRLHDLATGIAVPASDPVQDLVRGRRRARRRTTLIAGGATAACLVAAGVGLGATRGDDRAVDPADSTPQPAPSVTVTPDAPVVLPHDKGCPPGKISGRVGLSAHAETLTTLLSAYATTLASHLDPQGKHLQTTATGIQSSTTGGFAECLRPDQFTGIGTKLDWRVAGDPGLGVVQIEVTTNEPDDQQIRMQLTGWQQVAAPSGTVHAWTAQDGGDLAAEVERADGTYVTVAASGLFGNNTTVALKDGTGLTLVQLLQAAADPAYVMP